MTKKRILIIIPIYNCYSYFLKIVPFLKQLPYDKLIVDDGSEKIPKKIFNLTNFKIIKHTQNKGKGEALKTGFRYAKNNNYTGVFTIDGDNQHNPMDINNFVPHLDKFDLIVGKRNFKSKKMPLIRKTSNYLTSKILSKILNYKIEDAQSGYRYINIKILKNISLETSNYDLENELLIKAIKNNYRVGFIPVKTIYNKSKSNIRGFKDTFKFLKTVVKYGFK